MAAFVRKLLIFAITIAPICNIVSILAQTGADNLSNDYLQYAGLINQILSGGYDWLNFIHDTFYKTHSVALPVLLHLANARLFHFNIYVELYLGVVFALIRLVLWYQILERCLSKRYKWLLWPMLSALIFSSTQIAVFSYGDAALTIELSLLGFALAIWSLTLENKPLFAASIMLISGLIASFSWANGLVTWFVLFIALCLLKPKQKLYFSFWLLGITISAIPYIQYLLLSSASQPNSHRLGTDVITFFNFKFLINILGFPFANNIGYLPQGSSAASLIGICGLIFLFIGIVFVSTYRQVVLNSKLAVPFLFILHGLISVWQISIFRTLLAPWYTAVAITFWAGLFTMALVFLQANFEDKKLMPKLVKFTALSFIIFLPIVYIMTNLSFEDKSDYLFSRSPASASALRNWQKAPTYCEPLVFQWGAGNPGLLSLLAYPLACHQLSVFAPNEIWTLQGDFLLNAVQYNKINKVSAPYWIVDRQAKDKLPWYHFKHLNLLLPSPDQIMWTVKIPSSAQSADFDTAFAQAVDTNKSTSNSLLIIKITDLDNVKAIPAKYMQLIKPNNDQWHPAHISLMDYKGKRIKIILSSQSLNNKSTVLALFQYPHIKLSLIPQTPTSQNVCPENTDLSPDFVHIINSDLLFRQDNAGWRLPLGMEEGILLDDFDYFSIKMSQPKSMTPRVVTISFTINGMKTPKTFQIPLLAEDKPITYTYNLKLLELDMRCKLTSLKIDLVNKPANLKENAQIYSVALLRKRSN